MANAAFAEIAAGAGYSLKGFLNDSLARGEIISGLPVLGPIDSWAELPADIGFIPALHNHTVSRARFDKVLTLGIPPERWMNVRHPFSAVAAAAQTGHGNFFGAFAVVEPGARIGNFVCIRSGACISHDVQLGDFVFVGANSTIAGRSVIGAGTHLGPNASIRDSLRIASFTTIGIGAVVVESTESAVVIAGNPARVMPRRPQQ